MTSIPSAAAISPLRRRMIQDMPVRKFGEKTQHDYLGHIENFVGFWAARRIRLRPRASARYQVHQIAAGLQPPSVNSSAVHCTSSLRSRSAALTSQPSSHMCIIHAGCRA